MLLELTSVGIGRLVLGMTRVDAGDVLAEWGVPKPFRRGASWKPDTPIGWMLPRHGATVFVYCDVEGRVNAIEVSSSGHGVVGADEVIFDETDVFLHTADEVIAALEQKGHTVCIGENGYTVTVAEVLLALWRDGEPSDESSGLPTYFESVLVARPGYDD